MIFMIAPNFKLPDQDGKIHELAEYLGRWLLLYFYPKDDTPGCTKEACSFRDNFSEFSKRGIEVLGVSQDSPKSHKRFREKYHLNFQLLSDEGGEIVKAYGAWGKKKFLDKEYEGILRNSYLINPKGDISKEYKGVNPLTHAEEILKDFEELVSGGN
jgi:thioredoxin-dependent peroxiredoxin